MEIKKKLGETMMFSGGAEEDTPHVEVAQFNSPMSIHHGDKTLKITDTYTGEQVLLSLETMKAIIEWAESN